MRGIHYTPSSYQKWSHSYDTEDIWEDELVSMRSNSVTLNSYKATNEVSPKRLVSEIILVFNVNGMTCVSCSQTIENAIENEFGNKGLISC